MTVNVDRTPNHLALIGDVHVGAHFGALLSVTPVVYTGPGHQPHLVCRFAYGLKVELCRATAQELAREITESIVALPFQASDVHDAIEAAEG